VLLLVGDYDSVVRVGLARYAAAAAHSGRRHRRTDGPTRAPPAPDPRPSRLGCRWNDHARV